MENGFKYTLASWSVPLEEHHEQRDKSWYIKAITIMFILLLISIFTTNFLFAGILLLISFIYFYLTLQEPKTVTVNITEGGVIIGNQELSYSQLRHFWIVYEPSENVKCLYINSKNVLSHPIQIPLYEQDPIQIRQILANFLDEAYDEDGERASDTINRLLKL